MALPHVSYLGIFVLLTLTGAGLPVPEEVFILAAALASAPDSPWFAGLDPWLAWGACLAGALVGDCIVYSIGRHFGRNLLRRNAWYARLLHAEREQQLERMLQQHGLKVFLLARFLIGLRSPIYLAAGVLRVPFRRFLLVDLFCATLVISAFFALGYFCSAQIGRWWTWIRNAELALTLAVVLTAGVLLWYWLRRRRAQRQAAAAPHEPAANERTLV